MNSPIRSHGSAGRCSTRLTLRGCGNSPARWPFHRAGFSPVRQPFTRAASSTASMRWRTRDAVSGTRSQIGRSTRSTAAVSTVRHRRVTDHREGVRLSVASHCAPCLVAPARSLALHQHRRRRLEGRSFASASASACRFAARFALRSPIGSHPAHSRAAFSAASARALASVTPSGGCLLPMIVLALFWTHYAERYGWARLTHNGGYAGLTSRLVLLTRLHRLPAPFSPPLFLRREGRRLSRFGLGVIVIGAILTALISYHDRSSITLVRQNGIDVIDWQSLRPTHYAFGELKMLELRCSIEKSGERKVAIWI